MKLCAVAQLDVVRHGQKVVAASLHGVLRASTGGTARPFGVRCALGLGREKGEHTSAVSDGHGRNASCASLLHMHEPA